LRGRERQSRGDEETGLYDYGAGREEEREEEEDEDATELITFIKRHQQRREAAYPV
jgi:hypothetical protein